MTDYERHSLQLLSLIAGGIGLQVAAPNSTMFDYQRQEHEESVLHWLKQLNESVAKVSELLTSDKEARRGVPA